MISSDGFDLARLNLRKGPWNSKDINDIEGQLDIGKPTGELVVKQTLAGPELVDALPGLPDGDYEQGKHVQLSTNNQIYRATDTDEWTLAVEGPAQLGITSAYQRNLYNGAFELPPADTTQAIDNSLNELPGWTIADNSSGTMRAFYVEDATYGGGGYIRIDVDADAPVGTFYLQQTAKVISSATRNISLVPMAAVNCTTGSGPVGSHDMILNVDELDSTDTTITTGYANLTLTAALLGTNIADMSVSSTLASLEVATAAALFSIGISVTAPTGTGYSYGIYDTGLIFGAAFLALADRLDPTNEQAVLRYDLGSLFLTADKFKPSTLYVPTSTSPAQTDDGSMVWDSDDDHLTVGTGAGRVTMLDTGSSTYAVPSLTLGTANASGAATTVIRSDATILAFDATTPAAISTSGAVGVATVATRRDHAHAHEAAHINHDTTWAAKGDLAAGTANDTAAILTVGTDGYVLVADSTQTTGLAWAPALDEGLSVKGSCRLATAAALPVNTYLAGVITITATGTLTVDGSVTALGDRILVKDEVTQANNGIYTVTTAGAIGVQGVLTRSSDMNAGTEVPGAFAFVEAGTANVGAGFVVAGAGPYTIGVTAIVWTQFSGTGEITVGSGLTKSGNTLDRNALTGDVTASAGSNATTLATGNAGNLNSGTLLAGRMPALTGDVTTSAGAVATTITAKAVTLAKMDDLAQDLFIGRTTASTGVPQTATITAAARTVLDDTTVGAMRTTMGVGTGDSPQFTAVNIGDAADTTVSRSGAGDIQIEANIVYRAGGTDVPVADGGTGSSTATGAATNLGLGTGDSPQFAGVNLGSATATTLTGSAGVLSVEGTAVSVVGHGAADHADITATMFLAANDATADGGTAGTWGVAPNISVVYTLANAATQGCYWTFAPPIGAAASDNFTFQPLWAAVTTDGTSHTVAWSYNVKLINVGSDPTAAGTTTAWTGASAARTANLVVADTATDGGVAANAAANLAYRFNIRRVGADAADTLVSDIRLIGVVVRWTANQ